MRTLRLDVDRPAMLVVIHHRDLELTLANADLAVQGGADGVFLIDHSGGSKALLDVADALRVRLPELWIGVNLLGTAAPVAFGLLDGRDVDGLWSDAAGIDLEGSPLAREALAARERSGFAGLYFGGVEFKYQPSLGDVRRAADMAREFMDVICTSGPGTGEAADISKLVKMREGAGQTPLAVASGVTPENAAPLVGVVDAVLVATGVSHDFHHLDGDRIAALRRELS